LDQGFAAGDTIHTKFTATNATIDKDIGYRIGRCVVGVCTHVIERFDFYAGIQREV